MTETTDDLIPIRIRVAQAMGWTQVAYSEYLQSCTGVPPGDDFGRWAYVLRPDKDPAAFVAMMEWALRQEWNCGIVLEHSRAGFGCFISDTCGIAYGPTLMEACLRAVDTALRAREAMAEMRRPTEGELSDIRRMAAIGQLDNNHIIGLLLAEIDAYQQAQAEARREALEQAITIAGRYRTANPLLGAYDQHVQYIQDDIRSLLPEEKDNEEPRE